MQLCANRTIQNHGNSNTNASNRDLWNISLILINQPQFKISLFEKVNKLTAGIASLQLNPTAIILDAVCHVPKLIVSVAQYAIQVHILQVWCSIGTGSISALVHTCSGANADFCFGSSHALTLVMRALNWVLVGTKAISVIFFILSAKRQLSAMRDKQLQRIDWRSIQDYTWGAGWWDKRHIDFRKTTLDMVNW